MEILVVVTIIGILAAIAIPSYIYAVEQGREDACAANVQILNTQVERYRLETGNTVVLGEKSLVDFLKDQGYLVGQNITCPFHTVESPSVYQLNIDEHLRQTVTCTHSDNGS